MTKKLHKKDLIAVGYITLLTALALIWGFSIIPFPGTQQAITFDHKRVIALGQIKDTVDNYYNNNAYLPQSLSDLTSNADDGTIPLSKTDPQTGQLYYYIPTSQTTYKLCATFVTSSSKDNQNAYDDDNGDYASFSDQFRHPVGFYCFTESEPYTNPPVDNRISPTVVPVYSPTHSSMPYNTSNSGSASAK